LRFSANAAHSFLDVVANLRLAAGKHSDELLLGRKINSPLSGKPSCAIAARSSGGISNNGAKKLLGKPGLIMGRTTRLANKAPVMLKKYELVDVSGGQ
jgi:hypothetical protein